jgi:hypothetical protein
LLCGQAAANLPFIGLDRIFPLGGAAGSQVVVDLYGRDLDDVRRLHFDDPGLKAELVKPNQFRVTIAAGVPAGTHELRAVGKYGISAPRLFTVSRGLTEVREVEPNDVPSAAQAVPMNAAVQATSDHKGVDFFRFPARAGQRVTIDCQAFRLDSTLRAVLSLHAADGKELAAGRPDSGRTDPLLDFRIPADGDYLVGVHDLTYVGDLPYRLVISNHPQIDHAFPLAVVPGTRSELMLLGRNLPGGRATRSGTGEGLPLDQCRFPFAVPEAPPARRGLAFINHPAAPYLSAGAFQVWPPGMPDALNPVTLVFATAPVMVETEPNDTPETAQAVSRPSLICGRFHTAGDADWFGIPAKAGETILLDLVCERIESPGDPFLVVTDAQGQELATFDDQGENATVDGVTLLLQLNRDPRGSFTAPSDGLYRVMVQDRTGRHGARCHYALRVGAPEPDFLPVVLHETLDDPSGIRTPSAPLVRQGGSTACVLALNRRDGFEGPVVVEAEGLPRGVSCPQVHLGPNVPSALVVFTAAPDAPEWTGTIRLKAFATIAGKRVERAAGVAQRRWGDRNQNNASRLNRELGLAVRSRAPYGLRCPGATLTTVPGKTLATKVMAERYWPDFTGAIQLTGRNLPAGFDVPATDLPADAREVAIKINVAAEVPPGTYSLVLHGDAQVPFSADPAVAEKPKVRVADPAPPLTVTVMASPEKP